VSNPVQARFGRFELDEANGCLLRDGAVIAVAPTPFAPGTGAHRRAARYRCSMKCDTSS
jgi:hypothetical protein